MVEAIKEVNTECPERTKQKSNLFPRDQECSDLNLELQGLSGTKGGLPVRGRTCAKAEMKRCAL